MKYRLIKNDDSVTVIMEDGGVACIEVDEGDDQDYLSYTEYYQDRFTKEMLAKGDIWDQLACGKMYRSDWETDFDNPDHIEEALEWLCVGCEFELDEMIWPDF